MTTEAHFNGRKAMRAFFHSLAAAMLLLRCSTLLAAQAPDPPPAANYVVGPQDVLTINCYDQNDLSGKFTLETDGTFTYPLIGRVKAGGRTLSEGPGSPKQRIVAE